MQGVGDRGRPKIGQKILEQARMLYNDSEYTAEEVCKTCGIGRRTLFAYIKEIADDEYQGRQEALSNPPEVNHNF